MRTSKKSVAWVLAQDYKHITLLVRLGDMSKRQGKKEHDYIEYTVESMCQLFGDNLRQACYKEIKN